MPDFLLYPLFIRKRITKTTDYKDSSYRLANGEGGLREGKNYAVIQNFLSILHNFTPRRTYPAWFCPDLSTQATLPQPELPCT